MQRGLLARVGRWKISRQLGQLPNFADGHAFDPLQILAVICHLQPDCRQQRAVFGVHSDGQESVIYPVSWHRGWGKPTELQVD